MTPTPEQMAAVRATFPNWDDMTIRRHLEQRAALVARTGREPRFLQTYCSQCGRENGPADAGTSSCAEHIPADWPFPTYMGQRVPRVRAVKPAPRTFPEAPF